MNFCTDVNRLMQIVMNLLSNSLKFTVAGFVKLVIESENENGYQYVKISIVDSGIGIAEE